MTELAIMQHADQEDGVIAADAHDGFIPLSDPDITLAEIEAVDQIMRSPRLSSGPGVEEFEQAFAAYLGRRYAIAAAMMPPKSAAGSATIRRLRIACWFHTRSGRIRPGKSPGRRWRISLRNPRSS